MNSFSLDNTLYIRRAAPADLPRLMEIFSAARSFMRSRGNFSQWTGGYPSVELVSEGISRGEQYVVCSSGMEGCCAETSRTGEVPPPSRSKEARPQHPGEGVGKPVATVEALNSAAGDEIVATFWFSVAAEPTYALIFDGKWLSESTAADPSRNPEQVAPPLSSPSKPPLPSRSEGSSAYGVVHRLASDGSVPGVGALVLRWALARCGDVRVDTHRDNSLMQSLLRREGFNRCGTIFLADGSPRDAFERVLSPAEAKKLVREEIAANKDFLSERRSGKTRERQTSPPPSAPRDTNNARSLPPAALYESFASSLAHPPQLSAAVSSVLYEALANARTVALFHALPDEPSVDFLLDKWLGIKRLALPVVVSPSASSSASPPQIIFREYTGPECLRKGRFGILEPTGTSLVPPQKIDVMFVPGVAYIVDGQRLGRGGGFYDRYLSKPAAANIYKVGICAPRSLVEWFPVEEHDVAMNEILIAL